MGLLADIYSGSDSLKRKVKGLLADPLGTIEQKINQFGEDQQAAINNAQDATGFGGNRSVLMSPQQKQQASKALGDYAGSMGLAGTVASKFVYPQDKALEMAQRNAALPFELGGLGLRPNNTAAERARALGYQTGDAKTLFHATRDDVAGNIDPSKSDFGFHMGTLEQAEARVKSRSVNGVTYPEGANVMPFVIDKYANLLKVADEGSFHADALAPQLAKKGMMDKRKAKDLVTKLDGDWNEKMNPIYDQQMRDIVKQNGYDGLKYANAQEGIGTSVAISNPSVIRSRFAAFDPMRRNEADILGRADPELLKLIAGGGLLGAGGYAAFNDK